MTPNLFKFLMSSIFLPGYSPFGFPAQVLHVGAWYPHIANLPDNGANILGSGIYPLGGPVNRAVNPLEHPVRGEGPHLWLWLCFFFQSFWSSSSWLPLLSCRVCKREPLRSSQGCLSSVRKKSCWNCCWQLSL